MARIPGFPACITDLVLLGCQAFKRPFVQDFRAHLPAKSRSFPHMLDVMRSNARSSLIVLIFGAIIVTFIFSFGRGSSGFRTRTPETWAARVNGDVVTASDFGQAYASRFRQISAQRGGKYTTENPKQDDLRGAPPQSPVDQEVNAQPAK